MGILSSEISAPDGRRYYRTKRFIQFHANLLEGISGMRESDDEKTWTPMIPVPDEAIPAVAPDNDPFLLAAAAMDADPASYRPPFPGYQSRPTIEDQITESDRRDSRDLEIFILGALAGACWAGLAALAIL